MYSEHSVQWNPVSVFIHCCFWFLLFSSIISNAFGNFIFNALYHLTWVPFCGHHGSVGNATLVWNVCRQDKEKHICELLGSGVMSFTFGAYRCFFAFSSAKYLHFPALSASRGCVLAGNYVGRAGWVKLPWASPERSGSVAQPFRSLVLVLALLLWSLMNWFCSGRLWYFIL